MHFAKLDDSPMFRKQLQGLEESTEILRERTNRFYKVRLELNAGSTMLVFSHPCQSGRQPSDTKC